MVVYGGYRGIGKLICFLFLWIVIWGAAMVVAQTSGSATIDYDIFNPNTTKARNDTARGIVRYRNLEGNGFVALNADTLAGATYFTEMDSVYNHRSQLWFFEVEDTLPRNTGNNTQYVVFSARGYRQGKGLDTVRCLTNGRMQLNDFFGIPGLNIIVRQSPDSLKIGDRFVVAFQTQVWE